MIVTAEQTFCFIASWTGLEEMLLHLNLRIIKILKVFQQNLRLKYLEYPFLLVVVARLYVGDLHLVV